MLTQNAYTLMKLWTVGYYNGIIDVSELNTENLPLLLMDGDPASSRWGYAFYNLFSVLETEIGNESIGWKSEIVVGSGTTSPMLSDYNLEDSKTDDTLMKCENSSSINGFKGAKFTRTYVATFRNYSSADIAISEIGLIRKLPYWEYRYGSRDSVGGRVLLAREVLDTPITVEPNGTCTVTMTVEV